MTRGVLPSPRSEGPGIRAGVPSGPDVGDEASASRWKLTLEPVRLDRNVDTPMLLLQREHCLTEAVAPVELVAEEPE
jgi:hypothetical protein